MPEVWKPKPQQPSPVRSSGVLGWLRENLFSSVGNTLLTLAGLALLLMIIPPFIQWAVINASWLGDSRQICDEASACGRIGACWVFISARLNVFLYGFYPEAEYWRVDFSMLVLLFLLLPILLPDFFRPLVRQLGFAFIGVVALFMLFGIVPAVVLFGFLGLPYCLQWLAGQKWVTLLMRDGGGPLVLRIVVALCAGLGASWIGELAGGGSMSPYIGYVAAVVAFVCFQFRSMTVAAWRWVFLFTAFPVLAFILLLGGEFGLKHVETHYWGGLFLTLVVSGTGMGTALPIGILLALGRRSKLPVIRTVCITFIEFARGVPLVSVLFMASVMFPLFLPESVTFDKLLRALVGIAFFYAAYMAEVVRGGLQAIPSGQYEAAKALGWSYWPMMIKVILPQTLRLVIPGLANNFLSLLKDTTLVAVIGLFDLLGIAKAAMADAEWLGFVKESYIFAAVVFWVLCFAISRYCLHLERKYHTSYQ